MRIFKEYLEGVAYGVFSLCTAFYAWILFYRGLEALDIFVEYLRDKYAF